MNETKTVYVIIIILGTFKIIFFTCQLLSVMFGSKNLLLSVLQAAMSSRDEEPAAAVSAILSSALSAAVSAAMAVAMSVDAKADLATLLDEWEEAQQGTTEQLVSILTK